VIFPIYSQLWLGTRAKIHFGIHLPVGQNHLLKRFFSYRTIGGKTLMAEQSLLFTCLLPPSVLSLAFMPTNSP
jgi:hypothetical protein